MSIVILLRDDPKEINNSIKLAALNDSVTSASKQDEPVAKFREIRDHAEYKKRARRRKFSEFAKESYFRYDEPTPEDLLKRVEYDMDETDENWLQASNQEWKLRHGYELSENDFELVMDRLEKESYFESKILGKDIIPEVDEDAVCAICLNGDCDNNTNQIIFCDMCDLPVHQECYGVPYIPEGQWLCRRCLQSPSKNVNCELCPNKGGAFKQTEDNKWAHVICALWIPEVCFANTVFLEPIDNINQIPKARWNLVCYICKQKNQGACIQCRKTNCYAPFHVTCAQQAGLYMRIRSYRYEGEAGPYFDVMKEAYCDQHAPKDKASRKQGMYLSDDEETEEEEVESKNYYKKRIGNKRDSVTKARKILEKKRNSDVNPVSEPTINEGKVDEISKLIPLRGKKNQDKIREDIIGRIKGYWIMKRRERKGVPLLRRLQVSFGGNVRSTKTDLDEDKYTRLRYDLEKARLLVGEVKKRELFKQRLFKLSAEIVAKRYKIIDSESPATED